MKKCIFLAFYCILIVFYLASCSKDPASPNDPFLDITITEYIYKIRQSYPHDRNAFTQGLVYHDGYLYEGTGLYGRSSLRKVEFESGKVLQKVDLSYQYFGEGVTIFKNKIYQLTWLEKQGFIYGLSLFDSLDQFTYEHEGWGITHNDSELIISDGTAFIRFYDPQTMNITRMIEVTSGGSAVTNLNELEYIEGKIYANVWLTDWIVIINPQNGNITGRIDLTGLLDPADPTSKTDVLNGIAYDKENKRLFVTGKFWPKLFEIELVKK